MQIVDKYIDHVRGEAIRRPEKSWDKILLGFKANKWRMKLLPNKNISEGYHRLETLMMSLVADSLCREGSYVWGNIFAPCELMQCFGLNTLSIECLSCYMSGYHLEDYFIDPEHGNRPHSVLLPQDLCGRRGERRSTKAGVRGDYFPFL